MIKLSIIVPLYNSAKYIRKCLDSLLEQDIPHSDYEIVVVNDGSPDNSYDIVFSYTERYENIKLVSQENQGTSGARNTGIDIAQGKYMAFVDPDDYVKPNVYKTLLDKMEQDNLDMLRSDYTMVDENYNTVAKPKGAKNMANYSEEIVDGKVFLSKSLGYACFVWLYIYRSTLIKDNQLYYQKGFYIDDTEWLPRVLCFAERVSSVQIPTYFYVQIPGSLMRTNQTATSKRLEACFKAIDMLMMRYYEQTDRGVKNWYRGMNTVIVLTVLEIISLQVLENKKDYLLRLKKYKVFPLSGYGHSRLVRIKVAIANVSPELYIRFVIFSNRKK